MVVEIKYINETIGSEIALAAVSLDHRQTWITVDDFIDLLENYGETPIIFINHMPIVFKSIEEALIKKGWICKYCKDNGKGWHPYTCPLKPKTYTGSIYGSQRKCSNLRIGTNKRTIKMYDAAKWIKGGTLPLRPLSDDEYAFLETLSKQENLKSTPAAAAKDAIGKIIRLDKPNEEIFLALKMSVIGGIIETDYKSSHFDIAYHYDITSMYPYIVASIDRLPNIETAQITEVEEKANHMKYAYWTSDDETWYHCNVTDDIIPAGSIKMLLSKTNPMKKGVLKIFDQKNAAKKGSCEYNLSKLFMNSFIGTLIQKDYSDEIMPTKNVVINSKKELSYSQFYEYYTYIIARARKYITDKMNAAKAQGAHILQVNTDGFFTDVPIDYDAEKFLGSMRLEYVAHNLTIYACNQYVCDEEICIAGLPSELYKEGQKYYSYPVAEVKNGVYYFAEQKITLGETVYA